VKDTLKEGIRDIIRDTDIKDLAGTGGKKVKIPIRNLDEPWFHHDGSGINDIVRPGNDKYKPGDKIKRPEQGQGSGGGASKDGEGEDSFTFHLTKEEFLDLFFENCELPDLSKRTLAIINEEQIQRMGFVSEGPPSAMNVTRSMRGAKARRSAFRAPKVKKLRELEAREQELVNEIAARKNTNQDASIEEEALKRIRDEIEILKRRIKAVPYIDPIDLSYNNWARVQIPSVQAAMVCLMDVSGSMDETRKELAKTFFLLLYLFLMQEYDRIEITYITYHSRAQVVDEQNFYYGHDTGGTVTSNGLQLAYDVIKEKYPSDLWNVYLAHASDGDNYRHDNEVCKSIVLSNLMPLLQYYAYVQINPNIDDSYRDNDSDSLWSVYFPISQERSDVACAKIGHESHVYPVFVKLFERKK
jgi:uncharacterized sporulation protein YeaH/YhbH (DUF444 family)